MMGGIQMESKIQNIYSILTLTRPLANYIDLGVP